MYDDPQDRDTKFHPAPFLAQNQHKQNDVIHGIVKHLSFQNIYKIKK